MAEAIGVGMVGIITVVTTAIITVAEAAARRP
jgi:hypothetical protein